MDRRLRFCCLLLCILLLPLHASLPALAESAESSAPSIRVALRRLNLTDRADLTLEGAYTIKTAQGALLTVPSGSKLTVQLRSGEMYLHYSGLTLCAGGRLYFERNLAPQQENTGIRFANMDGLYPGHLTLTNKNGLLQAVLSLSVEDYLLGVVPYEMSDSFPLEALKAQAVCARTFALSHVKPNAEWDVTDTANDQVFHGVNRSYRNAAKAVQETAGIVGMYKGKLATCYYSASNGGQTELVENVWSGRGDWGYYAMKDDPYDLENPESIVRRTRLQKSAAGLPAAFAEILCNHTANTMLLQGYVPDPQLFRVDAIEQVTLGATPFDEPSRFVTEMTIAFRWSGKKVVKPELTETPVPAPTPAAEATASPASLPTPAPAETPQPTPIAYTDFIPADGVFTLTLPLFPEVAQALKLSINATDNEMITLEETPVAFVLESRRFGHGVGMSQRGAQWMAGKYGMTFDQIMDFYYPGMTLMVAPSGTQTLPTLAPELAATPGPPATPTPRPTLMPVTTPLPEGAYLASVEAIDDDSSLNLRAEPSMAADILMRLYKHQRLIVLSPCEDPAWVQVKTDSIEGYVMAEYLEQLTE